MFSGGNQSHPDLPGAVPSPPPPSHSAPALRCGQAYGHQGNTKHHRDQSAMLCPNIINKYSNTHNFNRNKLSIHRTGILVLIFKISKILCKILEGLKCFIDGCGLFLQDEIRVDLIMKILVDH